MSQFEPDEAVDKNILGLTKEGTPYTYDFYFGNTGIIDIFKPEGAQWFWDIYKKNIDYYPLLCVILQLHRTAQYGNPC